MRFDSPKNALMRGDVPDVFVVEAVRAQRLEIGIADLVRRALTLSAKSSIAFWRGVMSALRWFTATWSATSGFFSYTRRIAPCATTQYRQLLAPEVATMIISRSPLVSGRLP